jgi:hypothetical protein
MESNGSLLGRDLTNLFHTMPRPSLAVVENGGDDIDDSASVFSKHRIRKIGVANQNVHSPAESGSIGSSPKTKHQLLNSEIALLQATIRNKEMLLENVKQEMQELRLKFEQQSAEKISLKEQIVEMKEAAARIAEHQAMETQRYLSKVMDAEEKTLQATTAMELAANVHKAACNAQRAAITARMENSAYKRDKDRLINLLSLFEPAKALALQLQQIPSHYFPMPGISSSAISSITKAQQAASSKFVEPIVTKKLLAESSSWLSSKVAGIVLGWSTEHGINESISMPLIVDLHKLWSDSMKKAREAGSVSRLKKNRTTLSTPRNLTDLSANIEHINESRSRLSCGEQMESEQKQSANFQPLTHLPKQSPGNRSLKCWGQLLETGMSRLCMKTDGQRAEEIMPESKPNSGQDSGIHSMLSPICEDRRIISPSVIRSFGKTGERQRESNTIVPSDLLESLRQEMLGLNIIETEQQSPGCNDTSIIRPNFKQNELTLRNTNLRISLLIN